MKQVERSITYLISYKKKKNAKLRKEVNWKILLNFLTNLVENVK